MRRLFAFIATVAVSAPLWAMHCPQDMAEIDRMLENNPPNDLAILERVKSLREEGEELHNEGKHQESLEKLGEARELLESAS